ncbi:MAG: hypothetical protein ACYDH6_21780 [Acidimicrobiales bacterium]
MSEDVVRYRVRAYNTATASSNKIHDDSVARRFGFRGGLVPGVDVYAYLCHVPAERWGRQWLERGTITARFDAPVYDGDEVDIVATDDDGALALVLSDSAGAPCAVGLATLPASPMPHPDVDRWPSIAPPDDPPKASAGVLEADALGSIEATFVADRAHEYLDDVREHLALFRDERVAHPGWLLRYANFVLTANVRLGPWIHVESAVQLLGVVGDGDRVETRAVVNNVRERRGHRFVELDVLQVVGRRAVSRTVHTAIYEPRGAA